MQPGATGNPELVVHLLPQLIGRKTAQVETDQPGTPISGLRPVNSHLIMLIQLV